MQKDMQLIDGIQDYWTVRSESYSKQNLDEMNNWKREAWRKHILEAAPAKTTLDILDVGTGPGFFAINLALAGHRVTAVDVTEEMLNFARKNAEAYGADVTFSRQNGDTLSFPDASFDLIVNRNVIWNLERPEEALKEWKRVLRPGGRIVYFDANWYLYLFDEKVAKEKEDTHKAAANHADQMPEEKTRMLEDIARALPLSKVYRPEWDAETVRKLGMKLIRIQDDIGPDLLDEQQRLEYRANPMFMVCAEKGAEDD